MTTPVEGRLPSTTRIPRRLCTTVAAAILLSVSALELWAQTAGAGYRPNAGAKPSTVEQGVRWSELKPGQQAALKPLEREWAGIDSPSKQKWLELSARFPRMGATERERVQERMSEWTRLSPRERGEARLNFQEAKQLPPADRQARWKAYEALSPEQKQKLVERASPSTDTARRVGATGARGDRADRGTAAPQAKSNIVPNPRFSDPPKAVSPSVVQAGRGATTTLITKRPAPPVHQQTGMPKIAATPEFVDKSTLLPQRGPQGAATRSATAPSPDRSPDRK